MKHEETNDITTIMVEPTDERSSVVRLVSRQSKPVVVVLPENTAFRRPGDLLELKRMTSQRRTPVVLVIAGNERLRSWARRQGFSVFSSMETCAHALARTRITEPLYASGPLKLSEVAVQRSTPRNTEPIVSTYTKRTVSLAPRKRRQETLLLILVALLILGILGGVGFGYLLSIAHTAPGLISPASSLQFYHVGRI